MINIDSRLLQTINEYELWLLCQIAKRMGKDLSCFPSFDTLLSDTGWSKNTLKKHRKTLEDKGFLTIVKRWKGKGKQTSNGYQINTPLLGVYVTLEHLQNHHNLDKKEGAQNLTPLTSKGSNLDLLGGSNFGGGRGPNFDPLSINHINSNIYNKGENQILTPSEKMELIKQAQNQISNFFKNDPASKKFVIQSAFFSGDFEEQISRWVVHYSDNENFLRNPLQNVGKFTNWLRNSKNYKNANSNGKSTSKKNGQLINEETARKAFRELIEEGDG